MRYKSAILVALVVMMSSGAFAGTIQYWDGSVWVDARNGDGYVLDTSDSSKPTLLKLNKVNGLYKLNGDFSAYSLYCNVACDIEFTDVTVVVPEGKSAPAIQLAGRSGADPTYTLHFKGTNRFVARGKRGGIEIDRTNLVRVNLEVVKGATLYAEGGGTFVSNTSMGGGAGIGGNNNYSHAELVIFGGGTITAKGGPGAAGIGGGDSGEQEPGAISIKDCTVIATGGAKGAGIGGGRKGKCDVAIRGGTVSATGGGYAPGIGVGADVDNKSYAGYVAISGGSVTAVGGNYGAGIGGSYTASPFVNISGGTVNAIGNAGGAGIGTCANNAKSSRAGAGQITISGGTVTATSGDFANGAVTEAGGAGIGGGSYLASPIIYITGGSVTAVGGSDKGTSNGGAGIGGGGLCTLSGDNHGPITISGGRVTATGGQNAAGIGGGTQSDFREVEITGGTVKARGGASSGLHSMLDIGWGGSLAGGATGNLRISGGSVNLVTYPSLVYNPKGNGGAGFLVERTVIVLTDSNKTGPVSVKGLSYFGSNDIYPDDDNKIYLWLADYMQGGAVGEFTRELVYTCGSDVYRGKAGEAPKIGVRFSSYKNATVKTVQTNFCSFASKSATYGTLPGRPADGHSENGDTYAFGGWFSKVNTHGTVAGYDAARLHDSDAIRYTDVEALWVKTVPLEEALNGAGWNLTFTTGREGGEATVDDGGWYGKTAGQGVQSGVIGANQTNYLSTTVMGSGVMNFRWQLSSEEKYDYMSVWVDGVCVTNNRGHGEIQLKSIQVSGAGSHTIAWKYQKDGSGDVDYDYGSLWAVEWVPANKYTVFYRKSPLGIDRLQSRADEHDCEKVHTIRSSCPFTITGKKCVGWYSTGESPKRYDKGVLVHDLAPRGGSITLYPICGEAE